MFGKLLDTPDIANLENPIAKSINELFIRQQVSEVSEIFKSDFFCLACAKPLKCTSGVLHHMKAKHLDYIDADLLDSHRTSGVQRAKDETQRWIEHHRICSPDCEFC